MTQERRRLDAEWLREAPLRDILTALERDGEQARVVGGAVRNALIGEPHGDIDIATTALPPEVIRRVEAAGFKAVPTGIEHGTVTVVAAGRPFKSRPCAKTSRRSGAMPPSPSAATGSATPSGATSP